MTTALLSVSDKTGIVEFAQALHARGIRLLSTGGTAKLLAQNDLPVTEVSEITGFPEMLDGRVKTLHPRVHGGLLARRDFPEHMAALKEHGIDTIDLLIINLYPFAQAQHLSHRQQTGQAMVQHLGGNMGHLASCQRLHLLPSRQR